MSTIDRLERRISRLEGGGPNAPGAPVIVFADEGEDWLQKWRATNTGPEPENPLIVRFVRAVDGRAA